MTDRYRLAPDVQVREEDFGLLFYAMAGPRLYFIGSKDLLGCDFFNGDRTLKEWIAGNRTGRSSAEAELSLEKALNRLIDKGVLVGC